MEQVWFSAALCLPLAARGAGMSAALPEIAAGTVARLTIGALPRRRVDDPLQAARPIPGGSHLCCGAR